MSLTAFLSIIVFLLLVFQALQLYFFYRSQRILGGVFVLFFWCVLAFLAYNFSVLFTDNNLSTNRAEPKTIVIDKGATLSDIGELLYKNEIIRSREYFFWTASLLGLESGMKAGKYVVSPAMSNYALVKKLSEPGGSVRERITVVEGIEAREIASLFKQKLAIDSTRFMAIVFDSSFAAQHGIPAPNLEGYLFPETYIFNWGVSEREIIETLLGEFRKNIPDTLVHRADELGMTLHEIVTLASIIEGEAVIDEERPLISSVFHNRLKRGWRLQADPTIQYIIPDSPRRLLKEDLAIDSPYNTYKNM